MREGSSPDVHIRIEEHLDKFNGNFHLKHHELSEFRSDWRVKESLKEVIQRKNLASSAKRYIEEAILFGISFI